MIQKVKNFLRKLVKPTIILLLIIIAAAIPSGTFYAGRELGLKESKLDYQKDKEEAEKKELEDAMNKGVTLDDALMRETNSIAENLAVPSSLTSINQLLTASEIDNKLNEIGPFTIFVSKNEVIDAMGADALNNLQKPENIQSLNNFLLNQIIVGQVDSNALTNGAMYQTANGRSLRVTRTDSEIKINAGKVIIKDIKCRNGIIHIVDNNL